MASKFAGKEPRLPDHSARAMIEAIILDSDFKHRRGDVATMPFNFSDEQDQFRDSVQRFMREQSPSAEVRRLMDDPLGYDPSTWTAACSELGLAALHIPEEYGGSGFGHQESAIAIEEMGRSLFCGPYFSSVVLAANALLNGATDPEKQALLPKLANGTRTMALALCESSGSWDLSSIKSTAQANGDNHYTINGHKKFVIDGTSADQILVVARFVNPHDTNEFGLFVVEHDSPGLSAHALDVIDSSRRLAELDFANIKARLVSEPGDSAAAIRNTIDQATIALSNEMVGGCQYLLDSSVEYAKLRMQFGRPIGSFQAVKHQCADMLLEVENAKSAAYVAAAALDAKADNISALASIAKATASDVYIRTAAQAIQIHGGIGFTWDNDTHLWFKRAKSSEVLLGDANYHRERYLQALESEAA